MYRFALILGLLAAIGPFAIDMYLPAMPDIASALQASPAGTQLTLTAFFLAYGVSQLVYGPWADQAGRRLPLYFGLSLFVAASVGAALAPSLPVLVACRFLQGMGGAVIMVMPRAIVRDLHTGPKATRLMATVMLVISVSPMMAPLAGSLLMTVSGWRGLFAAMGVFGLLGILLTARALPETLPPERRVPVNLGNLTRGFRTLLGDPVFVGLTFVSGFGMASFFVFIASASFVYVEQFGLSPTGFSLAFAVNAIGFFSATQVAGPLAERLGIVRVITLGVGAFLTFTTVTLIVVGSGIGGLAAIMAGLFLANAGLGLVIPTTSVMAMDSHGTIAGLAASLGGTLQMVTGGTMIVISGLFFDGTAVPMLAIISSCAVMSALLSAAVLPRLMRRIVA